MARQTRRSPRPAASRSRPRGPAGPRHPPPPALWATWRLEYIAGVDDAKSCFFCDAVAGSADRENLLLLRGKTAIVMLNKFPYISGHLMVATTAHKGRLEELTPPEMLELWELTRRMTGALERSMKAQGFNIGLNLNRVAGAGVPGHLHVHVVPRWNGDTNFMPVISDTKVIPVSLVATYDMLHRELARS